MISNHTEYTIQRFVGLSTDTKPDANNGDLFLEMDTDTVYAYDAAGEQWREVNIAW